MGGSTFSMGGVTIITLMYVAMDLCDSVRVFARKFAVTLKFKILKIAYAKTKYIFNLARFKPDFLKYLKYI